MDIVYKIFKKIQIRYINNIKNFHVMLQTAKVVAVPMIIIVIYAKQIIRHITGYVTFVKFLIT